VTQVSLFQRFSGINRAPNVIQRICRHSEVEGAVLVAKRRVRVIVLTEVNKLYDEVTVYLVFREVLQ